MSIQKLAKKSIQIVDLIGRTRDVEGRYLTVLIHPELQMEPDAAMDWAAVAAVVRPGTWHDAGGRSGAEEGEQR